MSKEIAEAILFAYHNDGKVTHDVFREDDEYNSGGLDPFHRAEGLRVSVKDDFPGAIFAIGLNERARMLSRNTRMRAMGFDTEEYQDGDPSKTVLSTSFDPGTISAPAFLTITYMNGDSLILQGKKAKKNSKLQRGDLFVE